MQIPAEPTIHAVLEQRCGNSGPDIFSRIQTLFLNGMPVDAVDKVILQDGDSLALSAAMPGLVGATMRAGGILAGFRHSISYRSDAQTAAAHDGRIWVKLFNLLIKELGLGFLKHGILVTADDMDRLTRNLLRNCDQTAFAAVLDGQTISLQYMIDMDWPSHDRQINLHASFHRSN